MMKAAAEAGVPAIVTDGDIGDPVAVGRYLTSFDIDFATALRSRRRDLPRAHRGNAGNADHDDRLLPGGIADSSRRLIDAQP
jgi:hypothetical protein